jgi:hypothetical protein
MIFSHQKGRVSVRTQRYRLDHTGKLFDMEADPGQDRDISGQHPEVTARLAEAVARWKEDVLPKSKDDRPFPVGHTAGPTVLPARDGVPHGGIRRSANAPNCSFFTSWRNAGEDKITWDIEVAKTGDYEAAVYYTCARENIGSTVELRFQDSRIEGKVVEPHDPPLVGAEFDRVPRRGESYVKDFRPLRLGTVFLRKGRGELALSARDVPGQAVMDVRAVMLTLQ